MAVRLSALCPGCPLTLGRFVVLISVRGLVDPKVIARLERIGQLIEKKNLTYYTKNGYNTPELYLVQV
jgi:hypothetical protein